MEKILNLLNTVINEPSKYYDKAVFQVLLEKIEPQDLYDEKRCPYEVTEALKKAKLKGHMNIERYLFRELNKNQAIRPELAEISALFTEKFGKQETYIIAKNNQNVPVLTLNYKEFLFLYRPDAFYQKQFKETDLSKDAFFIGLFKGIEKGENIYSKMLNSPAYNEQEFLSWMKSFAKINKPNIFEKHPHLLSNPNKTILSRFPIQLAQQKKIIAYEYLNNPKPNSPWTNIGINYYFDNIYPQEKDKISLENILSVYQKGEGKNAEFISRLTLTDKQLLSFSSTTLKPGDYKVPENLSALLQNFPNRQFFSKDYDEKELINFCLNVFDPLNRLTNQEIYPIMSYLSKHNFLNSTIINTLGTNFTLSQQSKGQKSLFQLAVESKDRSLFSLMLHNGGDDQMLIGRKTIAQKIQDNSVLRNALLTTYEEFILNKSIKSVDSFEKKKTHKI